MLKIGIMLAVVLTLGISTQVYAANNMTGKVTSVLDGDTLKIKVGDNTKKIRFVSIDAPEMDSGRTTATDAKQFVINECLGKQAIVDVNDPRTKDSSGRTLGLVYCNGNTIDMNQLELEQDYAVLYRQYACDKVHNEFWNNTWIQC
jgi:Micrococcal nuclease (thermonuclease) homologs